MTAINTFWIHFIRTVFMPENNNLQKWNIDLSAFPMACCHTPINWKIEWKKFLSNSISLSVCLFFFFTHTPQTPTLTQSPIFNYKDVHSFRHSLMEQAGWAVWFIWISGRSTPSAHKQPLLQPWYVNVTWFNLLKNKHPNTAVLPEMMEACLNSSEKWIGSYGDVS